MRNGYRFPTSNLLSMLLAFVVIVYILVRTGMLLVIGGSFLLTFVAGALVAAIVSCVLAATHRSGAHRLAEIRIPGDH
jgi:hypothetical protein